MKNHCKRVIALLLMLGLLVGSALPAFAAAKPSIQDQLVWVGSGAIPVILLNWPEKAKVVSITSSNKAVLKVGKKKGMGPNDIYMRGVKPGKAKVTVKYKLNGKTATAKNTFTVKAYPNPFAWIKVNGKKIDLSKNKFFYTTEGYKKKDFTVSFKLNKNWKVEGLNGSYWIGDEWNPMAWKNGVKKKMPAKHTRDCAAIDIRNSKTGDFFPYEIWFIR